MMLTVVVPTRGRPRSLARCLAALARQEGCDPYEIVVADDTRAGDAAAGELVARARGARLVRTGGAGAAAARNAAVAAARGAHVLFTDDDCVPAPTWAARLRAALDGAGDVAGGRTENGVPGDPFVAASEAIRAHLEAWGRGHPHTRFIASNNLGCVRELALELPFDETYDGAGGEDRDWCARAAARGARFAYVDDAVVVHEPQPGALRFLRQHVRYGRGAYRFASGGSRPGRLQEPRFYAELLRRGFDEGVAAGLLVAAAQAATATGYVQEALRSRAGRAPHH